MINYEFINQSHEVSWKNYKQFVSQIIIRVETVLKLDKNYDFSIILVEPEAIRSINSEYRNIDKVTDVISFASLDDDSFISPDSTIELGDIFVNVKAIREQANDYGHSLKREFCFLITHGILHLLGYDHMKPDEEAIMIRLQGEILDEIAKR